MDPVKLIKQDHRTVKGLFRKFENARKRAERQKVAEQIIEELSVHTAIEEQLIYPALRARDKKLEEHALNALEQHHGVKLVLAELDKMKVDDERYPAKMHFVQEAVAMHIEEEERHLLPRFAKLFRAEELEVIAKAMMAMKQVAPSHPHPLAPDTPPGSVIAAMLGKLTDTGKDMIRRFTNGHTVTGQRRVRRRATTAAAAMLAKRARRASENRRGATAH